MGESCHQTWRWRRKWSTLQPLQMFHLDLPPRQPMTVVNMVARCSCSFPALQVSAYHAIDKRLLPINAAVCREAVAGSAARVGAARILFLHFFGTWRRQYHRCFNVA